VERELLLELGCEEIPASWLPALTREVGEALAGQLRERRLPPETSVETFSTPRRLTVRIERIPERQTDLEELVTGPPVAAGFKADGTPTPAAAGFASKQGVEVSALERIETPKGVYLGYRRRQRGRASVDVLPDVLGGTLRALTFPKLMHWDAMLEDGKGDLLFGRPIRWMLFLYGGRVVPFTIGRTPLAQSGGVQDVTTGAATYGHRFLTTSGRAGRAIKVRSFDEYRSRLLENFVILERSERHDRIARELDAKARRLQGRVSRNVRHESGLLQEVPDLVEYPSVIAGTFASDFLQLPDEVLTTTLIHHQHYFPVEDEHGKLKNAFLAVINTEPDNERTIARNAERVVTARLRDAQFFWEADRKAALESRIDRLATLTFHKKLGTYKEKAERIERLARWIATNALVSADVADHAALAARLSKADLATDMVREFPELQGIMGGVYARVEGQPEGVWKAIYYHYLPIGVEADAPPGKSQLGQAAATWAAVSLADKLDTIVGLFGAGEKPTGSRDPFALRRAALGFLQILTKNGLRLPLSDVLVQAAVLLIVSRMGAIDTVRFPDLLEPDDDRVGGERHADLLACAPHPVQTEHGIFEIVVVQVLDLATEPDGLLGRPHAVRIEAKAVAGQRVGQGAIAFELVRGREYATLQLVRREAVLGLEGARFGDQLVHRAHFTRVVSVWISKEQIRREGNPVAQSAAEDRVDGDPPLLPEDVQARELERGEDLRPVVVERGGGIRDDEPHLLEERWIVPDEVGLEAVERRDGTLAAAAHLAEADDPFVGLDFHDRADEASPVRTVGMPQRCGQRHRHRRGADVGDLHRAPASASRRLRVANRVSNRVFIRRCKC